MRRVGASQSRAWVSGNTLCYRKSLWQKHRFPDINEGEDTLFVWSLREDQMLRLSDSSFYVGQCDPCRAVITDVTAEFSELGYSGTNGSDVTIVNSVFRNNRIGIVPNSQDVEELPPVRKNTIVGNTVYSNDNLQAATASNPLYDALVGSGIAMTGTVDSLVARNRVYDHAWFGIVLALTGSFYLAGVLKVPFIFDPVIVAIAFAFSASVERAKPKRS